MFGEWERWAAEVLDSHVAYPLLGYFRSSHDNLSWISALGTVLDTASLVLTTIEGIPRGHAELMTSVGSHLVEDITNLGFGHGSFDGIDRPAFDAVYARLEAGRLPTRPADRAWADFSAAHATYARGSRRWPSYWAVPPASWFGVNEPMQLADASPRGRRLTGDRGSHGSCIEHSVLTERSEQT